MRATVHADFRLCVPRTAVEALVHQTGHVFRGGDEIWVRFEENPDRVILTVTPQDSTLKYSIESTKGRVLFPRAGGQFRHGDIFPITLGPNELIINLSSSS